MKIINIAVIICILLMIIILGVYLFLDIVFSFGIINPTVAIRLPLLITEYVLLAVLICLLIFKRVIQKK